MARERVKIPEGVQVELSDGEVVVRSGDKVLSRKLAHPRIDIRVAESRVIVSCSLPNKREKALTGTIASHISNLIRGVTLGFTYTMRLVYAHFPVKVSVKGDQVLIENFLGERHPRRARIQHGVSVEVKGDTIRLTGMDVGAVSQTAASIEQATRIKNKDPRVFQDGIYIVSKGEEDG